MKQIVKLDEGVEIEIVGFPGHVEIEVKGDDDLIFSCEGNPEIVLTTDEAIRLSEALERVTHFVQDKDEERKTT